MDETQTSNESDRLAVALSVWQQFLWAGECWRRVVMEVHRTKPVVCQRVVCGNRGTVGLR